ncbi:MAG: TetR/AcrR family transcriptional regulator [Lentisphaeria bacterium]
MPRPRSTKTDPSLQILDAAERVFAILGFDGASLRHIVQEAKVNLPTVYYHFGSKEGLFLAVFRRRFDPVRDEHLRQLRRLERAAAGRPLPVAVIMDALVAPSLHLMAGDATGNLAVTQLMGRIITDPNPNMQALFQKHFEGTRHKFLELLQHSCPDLPPLDVAWRFQLAIGAMAFTLCNPRQIPLADSAGRQAPDARTMRDQMVVFFATGFRAPATSPPPAPAKKPSPKAAGRPPHSKTVAPPNASKTKVECQ